MTVLYLSADNHTLKMSIFGKQYLGPLISYAASPVWCPVYTNLPSSLKLEKVPGQCCPKVVFVFTGTIISFTAPPNMCFYKGNSYGTGEKWDDGCDYKCVCTDAATGRYKCTQKCVTWNLPPICHLNEPAPGKCCKTPNCPYFVTINYPPDYQEE
ncbi:uncharacterized protein LOC132543647 [Ylistrum balloti]|uniref:uncharacterized protein LOC132543647 n=1 Tax=Ylistrum balloti TaxID=509963 RepID=UPI002905AA4E|nr:uncharacterized protein LOC132543647 [Ylistrum balloti]